MKNLLSLILISILMNGCKNNDEILTEKEVFAVIDKFDEGWKNKNADLVDSVLSEHYVYFTQSGQTFNRPNLISTAGSSTVQQSYQTFWTACAIPALSHVSAQWPPLDLE